MNSSSRYLAAVLRKAAIAPETVIFAASMFNAWLPITRIKIFGARVLYFFTTLLAGKDRKLIRRGGISYEVDLSEGIELSMYLFGNFQSHITRNRFLAVPADGVIIDIGANVGLMTLQFAQMVPEGNVYAFEPTHYALERLKKNISLNTGLAQRIKVVNSFVSETTTASPAITAYSSWKVDGKRSNHDHPVHLGTPKDTTGVQAVRFDDFVTGESLTRIDLIKIDTDGHEYEVLKGARESIAKFRPRIIFEIGLYVMDEKNIGFDFYYDYFSSLKYRLIDTKSSATITMSNYKTHIPKKGSTDLIAVPL